MRKLLPVVALSLLCCSCWSIGTVITSVDYAPPQGKRKAAIRVERCDLRMNWFPFVYSFVRLGECKLERHPIGAEGEDPQ